MISPDFPFPAKRFPARRGRSSAPAPELVRNSGGEGGKETNRRGITRPRRSRRGALDPLCGSASILHEARAGPTRRKDGETDFLLAGERGQRPLSPSGERTSARASGAPVNQRMCCSRKLHEERQSRAKWRRRALRSSRSLSTALLRARSRAASLPPSYTTSGEAVKVASQITSRTLMLHRVAM